MADVAMPDEIIAWTKSQGWGPHHIRWHVERAWDRLDAEGLAWAQEQGWKRHPIQEGEETNGLGFLAMHRVMIGILTEQFPAHAGLFTGWSTPPTDPDDPNDPVSPNAPPTTAGPFNADMAQAIPRIEGASNSFDGDDSFGMFVETRWRPFPNQPTRRSPDLASGIHNYLHGRFSHASEELDMGNPMVNIHNQRFWRLHGWIDRVWSVYRTATGRSDDDPRYKAAMEEARHHMMHMAPMAIRPEAARVKVPPEITRSISRTLFGG